MITELALEEMFEELFKMRRRTSILLQEKNKTGVKQIRTTKAQHKHYKINKMTSTGIYFSIILNINDINSPMQKHRLAYWVKKNKESSLLTLRITSHHQRQYFLDMKEWK